MRYWAEFLMPEHAKALAYYDHPFFGKWPAITENQFGSGTLLYEGTFLSDALQTAILRAELDKVGLTSADQKLPPAVHVQHGVNRMGKRLALLLQLFGGRGAGFLWLRRRNRFAERKARDEVGRDEAWTVGPCHRGRELGSGRS